MRKEENKVREKEHALMLANEAKDRLREAVEKLEALGYKRKAKSGMNLIYMIEDWKNRR